LTSIVNLQNFSDAREFLEVSRDAVFIIFDEKIVYANQQAIKLLGYKDEDELIGRWSVEFISPDNRRAHFRPAGKNTPFRYELKLRRKDGFMVDVETQISIIEYQGRPASLVFTRDISERKTFEAKLDALHKHAIELRKYENSEEVLRSTIRSLRDTLGFSKAAFGVVELPFITFREYNDHKGERSLSLEEEGLTQSAIRTGETQYNNDIKGNQKSPKRKRSEIDVPVVVDREVFGVIKVESEKVNAFDENDRKLLELLTEHVASSISIIREKDKLRKSLGDLEKSNKELDEYTYAVSHDLKAPLRTIQAFSDFLLSGVGDKLDEDEKDCLSRIINASKRMTALIEDLLTLSRINRKYLEIDSVNLNEMLKVLIIDLNAMVEEKGTEIKIDNELPVIRGHKIWIRQLFTNLVSNAVKFNKSSEPKVWVGYEDHYDYYQFSVKDNGIGIEEKNYEKIFRLFERLHTQEEFPGSGAGLTICKKIVDGYGGKIWVESKQGQETTFYFTIPKGLFADEVAENVPELMEQTQDDIVAENSV